MPERSEAEARADVARRLDEKRRTRTGPMAYEIGGKDDPDRVPDKSPGE